MDSIVEHVCKTCWWDSDDPMSDLREPCCTCDKYSNWKPNAETALVLALEWLRNAGVVPVHSGINDENGVTVWTASCSDTGPQSRVYFWADLAEACGQPWLAQLWAEAAEIDTEIATND